MDTLNKGTAEIISVQLNDVLGEISTLNGINCEQRIISEDEKTQKQNWTTVVDTEGMRVDCLIATDNSWDEGTYKLFIRLNIPPELPIKGPFLFGVS